jgi:hypothetical protein
MRKLDDGLFLGLKRFMARWRVHLVTDDGEVADQWCFDALNDALLAFSTWTGAGEPVKWARHPPTGRVRDPATGVVWKQDDPPVVF